MLSRASLLCRTRSATIARSYPLPSLSKCSLHKRNNIGAISSYLAYPQTQTRHFAGRKDRASTSFETRQPTKKQRKKYHKRRRDQEYEINKHSKPNSKAKERKLEDKEKTERLIEIAREEEKLKGQLGAYFEKVNELQAKIESSPKFQALLEDGKISQEEIKAAARDAAKKAADKSDTPHPPLPSWMEARMSYDWGDALIDDLMGNSADLTSSPSPYPVYMGGEYGRLRRRVERMLRGQREEERFLLENQQGNQQKIQGGLLSNSSSLDQTNGEVTSEVNGQSQVPDIKRPSNVLSDKLLSDLIRAFRDAHGKRTTPVGLAATLELLHDLQIPLSTLDTYSYVSLLTVCKSPWEARKICELRKEHGVRSNEYFWSALVDVYARAGDFRGAEEVLDEMLEESQLEYDNAKDFGKRDEAGQKLPQPIAMPPLPAYTSFFSACYKLIIRSDVHTSIKTDAANRAWARWKEMRIHSVAPDVMAYGALMRVFAAQGRAEQAIDLLDEIMMQMMMPVNAGHVMGKAGGLDQEMLTSMDGDGDGWNDDVEGKTTRVKPTTLLFTSALKAVSKSHEIASRFNGGTSKKNRKREGTASYHGRLTRKIVILAEQAEVKQDDGFVSALMLCAAAAGDSSTARAIYLASKVRRLDHLRTCGGNDHLKRLQGLIPEDEKQKLLGKGDDSTPALSGVGESKNTPALRSIEEEYVEEHEAYEHREYGTDTRILSTLLLAHSKAMESKGLGSMWAGRYNRGYLCQNSLRYIESYNRPQMENMAIPGLDSVKAGLSPEGSEPEDFFDDTGKTSKQLRKKHKFNIKSIIGDDEGNRKDDQDSFFDGFDDQDYDDVRRMERLELLGLQHLQLDGGGGEQAEVSRDWLSDKMFNIDRKDPMLELPSSDDGISTLNHQPGQATEATAINGEASQMKINGTDYGNDFDSDSDDDDDSDDDEEESEGISVPPQTERDALVQAMAEVTGDWKLAEDLIPKDLGATGPPGMNDDEEGDFDPDSYFDEDAFKKLMDDTMEGMDDSKGGDAEELDSIPGVSTNDFAAFTSHLKAELEAEGETHGVDEKEARQLFDMMRTYYDEEESSNIPDANLLGDENIVSDQFISENSSVDISDADFTSMTTDNAPWTMPAQSQNEVPSAQMKKVTNSIVTSNKTIYADDYIEWANSQTGTVESSMDAASFENEIIDVEPSAPINVALPRNFMSPLAQVEEDPYITELQQTLPGLPMKRIEKVSNEFAGTLGYPSILRLALAVRENMPEAFSPQCLTRVNLANAKHVMAEAEKGGMVDAHLLNGMLRVHTNSGRIEPALRFYDNEYKKHGLTPTKHSDRLLLEMLVKKKRIARAFKLKQEIENDGRSLDLLSYQSLVDHFGRHKQLGSALLLIKECISVHGSPPGEKSLKNIRLMCRQKGLTDQVGLEKLVGEDPLEWMRRGEELKRVQNKRGNSSALQYGMNRMVDI